MAVGCAVCKQESWYVHGYNLQKQKRLEAHFSQKKSAVISFEDKVSLSTVYSGSLMQTDRVRDTPQPRCLSKARAPARYRSPFVLNPVVSTVQRADQPTVSFRP